MLYTAKGDNRLIGKKKKTCVFKNMLYDSIGIFCRTYIFYLYIKKDFEFGEIERRRKDKEGKRKKREKGRQDDRKPTKEYKGEKKEKWK